MLDLNFKKLIDRFNLKSKKGLQHNTKIDIFPFNSKGSNDFKKFNKIQGEIYSNITKLKTTQKISKQDVMENILKLVETENQNEFTQIIDRTFFSNEGIVKLHPKIFIYDNYNPSTNIKKIGNFIFKLFFDDPDIKKALDDNYFNKKDKLSNPLETVFYKSLPELKEKSYKDYDFLFDLQKIQERFKKDFLFLINDKSDFILESTRLLKYYYFFYITQLTLKIDSYIKNDKSLNSKLYFTLENEKLSKTRKSYKLGWNKIEEKLNNLFSYRLLIDIINENNKERYIDLKDLEDLSYNERREFANKLNEFIHLYKKKINNSVKGLDEYNPTLENDTFLMKKIEELFKTFKYQFLNSKRKRANSGYSNCFLKFCKQDFLKRRGRLGYSLNINQSQLLFATKLVIKDDERIQLKEYWDRLSIRGINFDRVSKNKIIEMFDQMNILGKESDSGDAKYIRKI